jgi:hypothetical protein
VRRLTLQQLALPLVTVLVAVTMAFCGGELGPFPTVGPNGDVIGANGLLYAGNICDGFDASAWDDDATPPMCSPPTSVPPLPLQCTTWTATRYPSGAPTGTACEQLWDGGAECADALRIPHAACDFGSSGDAYCQALARPFIHTGTPAFACVGHSMGGPPTHWTQCDPLQDCPGGRLPTRIADSGITCVAPCQ